MTATSFVFNRLIHSEDPNAKATLRFDTMQQLECERIRFFRAINKNNLPLRLTRSAKDLSLTISKETESNITFSINGETTTERVPTTEVSALTAPRVQPLTTTTTAATTLDTELERMKQLLREDGMSEEEILTFLEV